MEVDWSGIIFALVLGAIVLFTWMHIDEKKNSKNAGENNKPTEQNSLAIDVAISYIEAGYKLVEKWCFEFPAIGLHMGKSNGNGFKVAIFLSSDDSHLVKSVLMFEEKNGWHISPDGKYLQKCSELSYKGGWNQFEKGVFNRVKAKHPNWKFNGFGEIMVQK